MDEQSSGALGGAASGAAEGAVIGSVVPGVGTVIGAVAGAIIGGALGLFGGAAKRKARLKAMQINNITRAQMEQEAAIQRRDIIRNSRINYARSLAQSASAEGEVSSSGLSGTEGSNLSQTSFNLNFAGIQAQQALQKFDLTGQMQQANDQASMYAGLYQSAVTAARVGATFAKPDVPTFEMPGTSFTSSDVAGTMPGQASTFGSPGIDLNRAANDPWSQFTVKTGP